MKINAWDVLPFVVGFLLLILASAYAGLFWWVVLWFGVACVLGIVELLSVLTTRKTLSEKFWELLRTNPKKAYLILGLFWAAVIALTWHLLSMR